jgi:Xaa-Pro aminopeptidase
VDGIGEGSSGYGGDHALERLLNEAGLNQSIAEIRGLIAGVNAAPRGNDPDAWLNLFNQRRLADPLRVQLKALREELAHQAGAVAVPDHAARVAALRSELFRRGLSGFVVPRSDEHQGEYVPARADRLAWISGFTGSAGLAIVMLDQAAIFVDGRYTLQVQAEVSPLLFQYKHLTDDPHADWAASALPQGARLGYDPWLHTVGWVDRMRSAVGRA